jgi:hypothetical protein
MSPVRPGTSKYDITPKYVLRLKKRRTRLNKQIGGHAEHYVYIWIQRPGRLKKGRQEKDRIFHVVYAYIPCLTAYEDKPIIERKEVQKESIALQLKDGYDIISRNVPFDWKPRSYERFYRLVGLL